jgi:hypothetical protein
MRAKMPTIAKKRVAMTKKGEALHLILKKLMAVMGAELA